MAYELNVSEKQIAAQVAYRNRQGNTECVEFIRQTTAAPRTDYWKKGKKIADTTPGEIKRGTAIATFDEYGRYPKDARGKHAAIYLRHDARGITVLDQWNAKGKVTERTIRFDSKSRSRSNDANSFYVIE
jgi:hypothetical protein